MTTVDILDSLLRTLKIEMYYYNDKGGTDKESLIEIARITEQMNKVALEALSQKN